MAEVNEKGQKILLCIIIDEKVAKFFTRWRLPNSMLQKAQTKMIERVDKWKRIAYNKDNHNLIPALREIALILYDLGQWI